MSTKGGVVTDQNEQLVVEVTIGRWQNLVAVRLNNSSTLGFLWGEAHLDNEGSPASDPRTAPLILQVKYFPSEVRILVQLFRALQSIPICGGGRELIGTAEEKRAKFDLWFTDWYKRFTFEEIEFRRPVPVKLVLRR